ncbi:uncharacterized protein LOC110844457 [Folsomia candida]|uniref:Uncharacterized protein n=1 Tax=Folsomia candida TaxID=158441 RepID=A0A226F364_FOLCA|nr:uncharacterized protein LOC110844457 [Folsomia candida]OXA64223.1 hypothetical protein Fcan01_00425 [Folsomia candida]
MINYSSIITVCLLLIYKAASLSDEEIAKLAEDKFATGFDPGQADQSDVPPLPVFSFPIVLEQNTPPITTEIENQTPALQEEALPPVIATSDVSTSSGERLASKISDAEKSFAMGMGMAKFTEPPVPMGEFVLPAGLENFNFPEQPTEIAQDVPNDDQTKNDLSPVITSSDKISSLLSKMENNFGDIDQISTSLKLIPDSGNDTKIIESKQQEVITTSGSSKEDAEGMPAVGKPPSLAPVSGEVADEAADAMARAMAASAAMDNMFS